MTSNTPNRRSDIVVARERTVDGSIKAATPAKENLTRSNRGTPKASTPIDPKSAEKQNGEKRTRLNGQENATGASASASASAATQNDSDSTEDEIESLESHRVDTINATVDIRVKWASGDMTWEPEWSLQEQVPTLVYKYWDKLDGRDSATGLDTYHVFRILKRTAAPAKAKHKYMYQVQWTGYRTSDTTWEHEEMLQVVAPGELDKYEAKLQAMAEASEAAQKRKAARGPGRPHKKAKSTAA